jgi:hypothetical protein
VNTQIGITPQVTGAGTASAEIARVYQELRNGTMSVKEANFVMGQYSDSLLTQRRAITLVRTEFRDQYAATLEAMRGLQAIGSIGNTLMNVYNSFNLSQIRLQDQTRNLSDSQESLVEVQGRLRKVSADLGSDSVYAQALMQEETRLKKKVADDTQDLTRAQEGQNLQYIAMGLNLIGVVPKLFDLGMHIRNVKVLTDGLTFSEMIGGLGKIPGVAAAATLAMNAYAAACGAASAAAGAVTSAIAAGGALGAGAAGLVGGAAVLGMAAPDIIGYNTLAKGTHIETPFHPQGAPWEAGYTEAGTGKTVTELEQFTKWREGIIAGMTEEQKRQYVISGNLNVTVNNPANADDLITQMFAILDSWGPP